jgi:hypothetical protein
MRVTLSLRQWGRQPKGCAPLTPCDPLVKLKCSNNIPAQRGPDEAGLLIVLNIFVK